MPVEVRGQLRAAPGHAANDLGNVRGGELAVSWIHSFRREGEKDVGADDQAGRLQPWLDHLFGGAGERRALEHEELAPMQVREQALQSIHDEGDVRLLAFPERSGDADDERVGLPGLIECGGGGQSAFRDEGSQGLGRDVDEIRLAAVEPGYALEIDIDPAHGESGLGQLDGEGKPDIAEADNVHAGSALRDLPLEFILRSGHVRSPCGCHERSGLVVGHVLLVVVVGLLQRCAIQDDTNDRRTRPFEDFLRPEEIARPRGS